MNFDSKENGGKKSISYEHKASISCIIMWRSCLWCPITKKMEIIMRIHVHLTQWMNTDFKEMEERKAFYVKSKH